jgi:cellulose synthase (UDP-forming)
MPGSSTPLASRAEEPAPESPTHRQLTHAVAVTALAVTAAYLGWRGAETMNWSVWWLSLPLLLVEIQAAVSLALFAHATWDTTVVPDRAAAVPAGKIAVLIPTYNEAPEVLLPTIAAAAVLKPSHETWVLDDGDRPEVAALTRTLGVRYLARATHEHAKAGNLNHALEVIDADFIAVLDADHVALPGFLLHTLGYFIDPKMAIVQTPQDFYNIESFEHQGRHTVLHRYHHLRRYNEQELFYRVIQPGKNRWGGAFWCGTSAVVRTAALRDVGGVAVDTVTEDIHTTIRLHRRGWRTHYHDEVLARGLAAADAKQYASQRVRWGTGAMGVLRVENPLVVSGLTPGQRLTYAATLLGWFDSWRSLTYLLLPPAVLFTGALPIRAARNTFLIAFGITFVLQRIALQRLTRGRAPIVLSTLFDLVRMESNLRATTALFTGRSPSFQVTPKGRVGEDRARGRVPLLLEAMLVVSLAAAGWFVASAAGLTPLHYGTPWAAYGAAMWLTVNTTFVVAAALRIRHQRFGSERRGAVRFSVHLAGALDGAPIEVADLSLTGARVIAAREALPPDLSEAVLQVDIDGAPLLLMTSVRFRRVRAEGTREELGLEFSPNQNIARSQLALALFHTDWVPRLVPAPARRVDEKAAA